MNAERVCELCGDPLTKRQIACRNRFCSRDCYGKWMSVNQRGKKNPLYRPETHEKTHTCETCGTLFKPKSNTKGRFCSHKCHGKWARGENNPWFKPEIHTRFCEVCGKPRPVQNGRFCSNKCMSEGVSGENSSNWRPELHEGNCEICGNPLTEAGQTQYCSNICRGKGISGGNAPNWRGGLSYELYGQDFSNALKEMIRDRDNRECQYCGISESNHYRKLDVHHINYMKKDNRETNLISLCKKCHSITNAKRYFWEAYFKMKIQEKDSIQSRLHIIKEVKE